MRSRAARWTFVTVTWIAFVAAGWFLFTTQKQITAAAAAVRAVDQHAHDAALALGDARTAQQAYVAVGQGVTFWVPKVQSTSATASAAVSALREAAGSAAARSEVDEVTSAMNDFASLDTRARDYIRAGQTLMAGDVIYTEGNQAIATAEHHVELARQAEHQAFDAREAALRKKQAIVAGGVAGLAALITLLLVPSGAADDRETIDLGATPEKASTRPGTMLGIEPDEGIVSHARPVASKPAASPAASGAGTAGTSAAPPTARPSTSVRSPIVLKAAADLATDFGRARDTDELQRLLGRAADLIDASGLIVWIGDTSGGDLRAALSHGYSSKVLTRIGALPRNGDNIAATAYRTGALQILPRQPGGKVGAIVAPILSADGCVGALSAEINDGGEGSEAVQAVTAIVAAHLASVLAVSSTAANPSMPEARAAAQG